MNPKNPEDLKNARGNIDFNKLLLDEEPADLGVEKDNGIDNIPNKRTVIELSPEQESKFNEKRNELVALRDREEFKDYIIKKSKNKARLFDYVSDVTKQIRGMIKNGEDVNVFELLLDRARKNNAKVMMKIMEQEVVPNMEKEKMEKSEEEAKIKAQQEAEEANKKAQEEKERIEKEEAEKKVQAEIEEREKIAVKEADEADLKEGAKMEKEEARRADQKEVERIEKEEFERKASEEKEKIEKEESTKKDTSSLTMQEVYEKLKLAGADDKDADYFFSLNKKDRLDFLLSDEEELVFRMEKLRETREASEKKIIESNLVDTEINNNEELKFLGKEVEKTRKEYVEKESEIGMQIFQLKRFFKNLISVDKNYEIKKELEDYNIRYQEALKNYSDAMVEIEKPTDNEEREILYRYARFGETLRLLDAKEDLKLEKNPKFEATKRYLALGTLSFIDKYKNLLGKPKELIARQTDSKILGFGGGMIAIGGTMAFAANYIPGLRGITRALSIAVATKGFYSRAEAEAVMEKEKSLQEGVGELESRISYIDKMNVKVDEVFKNELAFVLKDIPETAVKEREDVSRRFLASFGKAFIVSSVFYMAGNAIKESGLVQEGMEAIKKLVGIGALSGIVGQVELDNTEKPTPPVSNLDSEIKPETPIEKSSITREKSGVTNVSDVGETKSPDVKENKTTNLNPADKNINSKINEYPKALDINDLKEEDSIDKIFNNNSTQKDANIDDLKLSNLNNIERGMIEGKGIKDTLAKFLTDNRNKFTDGKMGWNPNKYASVEEWASKRATGIVGEFTEGKDYNFDQVSTEAKFTIDASNPADIKITNFNDPHHLGSSNPETSSITEKNDNFSAVDENKLKENITSESKEKERLPSQLEKYENNILATHQEIELAYRLGIDPDHYSELKNISVRNFMDEFQRLDSVSHGGGENSATIEASKLPEGNIGGSGNRENNRLGRILRYLSESGKIKDNNDDISDVLRNVKKDYFLSSVVRYENSFGNISDKATGDLSGENWYGDYMSKIIQGELKEMMNNGSGEGNFMKNMAQIRGNSMLSENKNVLLLEFKNVVKNNIGNVSYGDNDTVGKYILKSIKRAYEIGEIDKLKEAVLKIKLAK